MSGAVAVLFLFVVMMLDVNFAEFREGFQRYAPVGATIGLVLFAELASVLIGWDAAPDAPMLRLSPIPAGVQNTRAIGSVLYTDYILLFQMAGLVLLVAMVGAIVLTHRERRSSRRQDITAQQDRAVSETLEILSIRSGAGVQELGIYRPRAEPAVAPAARLVHDETASAGEH